MSPNVIRRRSALLLASLAVPLSLGFVSDADASAGQRTAVSRDVSDRRLN
jgi:hypothetical protein